MAPAWLPGLVCTGWNGEREGAGQSAPAADQQAVRQRLRRSHARTPTDVRRTAARPPQGTPALAFVRAVCHLYQLDGAVADQVRGA